MTELPPELAAEGKSIENRRRVAQLLMQQGMQPVRSVNQRSPVSWTQGLAQVANAYFGRQGMNEADQADSALGKKYQQGLGDEVKRIAALRQGQTIMPDPQEIEQANDQGTAEPRPSSTGNPRAAIEAAMVSQYAPVRQMGALEHKTYENEQTKANDREARLHERVLTLDAAARNQDASAAERAARAAEAVALRRELAAMQDATRREIAQTQDVTRREIAEATRAAAEAARQQKNTPKLPTPALKLQQEELDAIGTASSINADLGGIATQIEEGKLKLSLGGNVAGSVRNFLGISNDNSKNLASFKSTLERLRNESLRLNKGVQTEGDAQRAWNELISNINDKGVVKQRLGEIQKLNERAANLRKMNVEVIRSNFGVEPMDTAGYTNQPATVGGGPAVGTVQGGYRFKGGDPSKQESWEKVP